MAAIELDRLDHFVMPCGDVEAVAAFYVQALDMEKVVFGKGRVALHFGRQKINLQPAGGYPGLHAPNHLAGTQDFCLISPTPLEQVKAELEARGVELIEGPVPRSGAMGEMTSLYFRDPEGNLVEISNY
ncbi:MAG: VOC family protein [Alphaproteobacteria bacterium]|jgi:catechol 2,3-dioxygenase-like lactoylglutathione lyase family enzyme|nr:VOC family protein [Alphaproteobacteria bacterium]MDP6567663.1 VOC family protein [Alphaproteobacteria bacterium]MDP6813201.1 VOC family protein [Alphaproteobacteria bacterium]